MVSNPQMQSQIVAVFNPKLIKNGSGQNVKKSKKSKQIKNLEKLMQQGVAYMKPQAQPQLYRN